MPRQNEPLVPRRDWKFESIEERLALSAQSVALDLGALQDDAITELATTVASQGTDGHGWTDVTGARRDFGLSGSGQTVAVIDSGIAYDHIALGGGLGAAYRVVGGWDFAENDANPYDDAPAGYHGTHVAGIVGAQDSRYAGVAPNADLVALRVFDDQGNGQFAWIEQRPQVGASASQRFRQPDHHREPVDRHRLELDQRAAVGDVRSRPEATGRRRHLRLGFGGEQLFVVWQGRSELSGGQPVGDARRQRRCQRQPEPLQPAQRTACWPPRARRS